MENKIHSYIGLERRRYKRIDYWTYACYRKPHKDTEFKHAQIRNISEGGLLLQTREKLDLDNFLEVKLYIPYVKGYHLLKSIVKPVWHKRTENKDFWHTGVEFQYVDAESKDILVKFINSFQSQFISPQKGNLKDSYLHIPYWCITKQTEISKKYFPKLGQEENTFHVTFEFEKKYSPQSEVEIEIKIPTITMPFKTHGVVLETEEIKKDSNYNIYVQLNNLTKEQLQALKKFAQK